MHRGETGGEVRSIVNECVGAAAYSSYSSSTLYPSIAFSRKSSPGSHRVPRGVRCSPSSYLSGWLAHMYRRGRTPYLTPVLPAMLHPPSSPALSQSYSTAPPLPASISCHLVGTEGPRQLCNRRNAVSPVQPKINLQEAPGFQGLPQRHW